MNEILFQAEGLSKTFGSNYALKDISFEIRSGEVLGLIGENGAGKSTLLKIINGVQPQTDGTMTMRGAVYAPKTATEARKAGVGMVFQEQSLINNLTVGQNLFFGQEGKFTKGGAINWKKLYQASEEVLKIVGLEHINPHTKAGDLPFSTRQMIEIAKALNMATDTETAGAEHAIILLDEPTSVLNDDEVKTLFCLVRDMKAQGHGVVFISHRLDEVLELTDRIVVFRDGRNVGQVQTEQAGEAMLYELMVGRATSGEYYKIDRQSDPDPEVVMQVEKLCKFGEFKDVSFKLCRSEVLGLCGVEGSGKESLVTVLTGEEKPTTGSISIDGKPCKFSGPHMALRRGLLGIPKERRDEGIIGTLDICENICICNFKTIKKRGFLSKKKQIAAVDQLIQKLSIKCTSRNAATESLSGGNAQKVLFARLLHSGCHILLLDHPTRGVDIGAKEEIYSLIREVTGQGISVILLGDTLDECIGLSNRVIVMKDGLVTGELEAGRDSKPEQVDVIRYMM